MDENGSNPGLVRPRDLATLLLASGDLLPRKRARDQQSDVAGNELKRRVLERLVALDPEPEELPAVLERIVQEIGEPLGPVRAVACGIQDEFQAAWGNPQFVAWLLDQAAGQSAREQTKS